MEFTKIRNDIYGNPRYVVHYLECMPKIYRAKQTLEELPKEYQKTVRLMRKLGGRKYHSKKYGGGITFSTYDTKELEKHIRLLKQEIDLNNGIWFG